VAKKRPKPKPTPGAARAAKAQIASVQLSAIRHTKQWVLGLAGLCGALGAAYLYLINVGGEPTERDANLQIISAQGATSWRLADGFAGMPVLCGCQDPTGHEFGEEGTPWEGTLLPADQFSLSVEGPETWAIQAIAPDSGPAQWSGGGIVPLDLAITVGDSDGIARRWNYSVHIDKDSVISSDGAYGLTMSGFDDIDVDVDDRGPLMSVLSPAGSKTAVRVESGARPFEPAAAGLLTEVPAHPGDRNLTRPGVIVNIASESTLTAVADANSQIVVGTRALEGITPGANVEVVLSSPIGATQVMAFPATDSWLRDVQEATDNGTDVTTVDTVSEGVPDYHVVMPPEEELPAHVVRLDSVLTPSESGWQSYLKRAIPKEGDYPTGLPPLPSDRRIEVFGPVQELRSNAMSGSVSVGSETWAITQADAIKIRSSEGLRTGSWTPSLSLSIGAAPVESSLSAKADVTVGVDRLTVTDGADAWADAVLNGFLLLAGTAFGLLPEWRRLRREELALTAIQRERR